MRSGGSTGFDSEVKMWAVRESRMINLRGFDLLEGWSCLPLFSMRKTVEEKEEDGTVAFG